MVSDRLLALMLAWLPQGGPHHKTSLGREQKSKFEVQFLLSEYGFCTIVKSKTITRAIVSWGLSPCELVLRMRKTPR